jgi:hypothetical protein
MCEQFDPSTVRIANASKLPPTHAPGHPRFSLTHFSAQPTRTATCTATNSHPPHTPRRYRHMARSSLVPLLIAGMLATGASCVSRMSRTHPSQAAPTRSLPSGRTACASRTASPPPPVPRFISSSPVCALCARPLPSNPCPVWQTLNMFIGEMLCASELAPALLLLMSVPRLPARSLGLVLQAQFATPAPGR